MSGEIKINEKREIERRKKARERQIERKIDRLFNYWMNRNNAMV